MNIPVVSQVVERLSGAPAAAVRFVLSESLTFFTEEVDLTQVLLDAIDLNAVLARVDLSALLDSVDLNRLLESVDLNRVLAAIDLNAVLDTVDLPRLLARIDLNALVADLELDPVLARVDINAVLDGVDMSSVVRGAGTTVTTEMISDVRSGSERADDAVEGIVRRFLGRKSADDAN